MSEQFVDELLGRPEFSAIDATCFPAAAPLRGILHNDCREAVYRPGELIVREGDYGNSAFLVLSGSVRAVLPPGLPQRMLGRTGERRIDWKEMLLQPFRRYRVPEARNTGDYAANRARTASGERRISLLDDPESAKLFGHALELPPDGRMPALPEPYRTAILPPGSLFGEVAALGRVQRTATVYAETECRLLEMRWQALRDIKNRDEVWRQKIESGYRSSLFRNHLAEHPLLAGLDEAALERVAADTLFETYGSFEWNVEFKSRRGGPGGAAPAEPRVASQGDYPDGLLLVTGGFGRVSVGLGASTRTLTYLRNGDQFGLDELYEAWKSGQDCPYETSLTALGYLHALRIPYAVLAEHVFPRIAPPRARLADAALRPIADDAFLEWSVEERFINGSRTMLIDLERCVRCDDCVRACADTHGGNPRFVRQGTSFGNYMVANACMHCVDPVCMIGCPTGAIHRSVSGGSVVINDITCIGCGSCANSCPYDNIRLVAIRDLDGRPVLDPASQEPILKATKCDLCHTLPAGPSCERACAHGALQRIDLQTLVSQAARL